jgi:hypothetical protein
MLWPLIVGGAATLLFDAASMAIRNEILRRRAPLSMQASAPAKSPAMRVRGGGMMATGSISPPPMA